MKRTTAFLVITIIVLPTATLGQSRRRTARSPTRSASVPTVPAAKRAGATRVADQVKTLTRFLYVLGGVAKGLEGVDDAVQRNEASPTVLEQAKRNKVTVRTSIQSVKEGLDALEISFRATPELQRYYIKLAGAAAGAATAEDQAAAGQFDRAGRTLLDVVSRLTDVLLEMQ